MNPFNEDFLSVLREITITRSSGRTFSRAIFKIFKFSRVPLQCFRHWFSMIPKAPENAKFLNLSTKVLENQGQLKRIYSKNVPFRGFPKHRMPFAIAQILPQNSEKNFLKNFVAFLASWCNSAGCTVCALIDFI